MSAFDHGTAIGFLQRTSPRSRLSISLPLSHDCLQLLLLVSFVFPSSSACCLTVPFRNRTFLGRINSFKGTSKFGVQTNLDQPPGLLHLMKDHINSKLMIDLPCFEGDSAHTISLSLASLTERNDVCQTRDSQVSSCQNA